MEPGARIRLIQAVREKLEPLSWDDEVLLLTEFGIGSREVDGSAWNTPSLTEWLQQADTQHLIDLARHLDVLPQATLTTTTAQDVAALPDAVAKSLFVFASHRWQDRGFVSEVESELQIFGIHLFIAHQSIEVDSVWAGEIIEALSDCQAGAVFLFADFNTSVFCQQEVGWLLGRAVPVAKLMLGETPEALLGQKQGIQALGDRSANAVAKALLGYFVSKVELHPHLVSSLAYALNESNSFYQTDMIWERLRTLQGVNVVQAETILQAAERNSQVFRANVHKSGNAYRFAIATYLEGQQGLEALTDRIQRLRANATTGQWIYEPGDVEDD